MNILFKMANRLAVFVFFFCFWQKGIFAQANDKQAWRFKREITVANQGNQVLDAVIAIELDGKDFDYAKTQANGADIRFFTAGKSGQNLSYWVEQWNKNGVSKIWLKVPVLKPGGQNKIYLQYGNAEAKAASDGNATFLFFDDFEDCDYTKKWDNISIGEVVEKDGLLKLKETDGQDGIITAKFTVSGQMIIRTVYQREGADGHWVRAGIGGWNKWLCVGDHTDKADAGTNYVMIFDSASTGSLQTPPLVKAANTVITDKWRAIAYWFNGHSLIGKQDDVAVEFPATDISSKLALRTLDNDSWDNFTHISVSYYLSSEPIVVVGKEKEN